MNDELRDQANTNKKPYSKPDIRQVSLRPEEAVLGSCKTSKISGPGQGKCSVPSACSSLGS
jgi:hypothetical protein